jgi:hypothetical protein
VLQIVKMCIHLHRVRERDNNCWTFSFLTGIDTLRWIRFSVMIVTRWNFKLLMLYLLTRMGISISIFQSVQADRHSFHYQRHLTSYLLSSTFCKHVWLIAATIITLKVIKARVCVCWSSVENTTQSRLGCEYKGRSVWVTDWLMKTSNIKVLFFCHTPPICYVRVFAQLTRAQWERREWDLSIISIN